MRQADRRDIERRLCRVLEFALTTLRLLVPALADPTLADKDRAAASGNSFEKLIAETGLLLLVAGRTAADCPALRDHVDALARALQPHARSDRILAGMLLQPAFAYEYAAAHVCLSRLGYGCQDFDGALAASLAASVAPMRERLPFQELESAWLAGVWGAEAAGPARRPSAQTTGIGTGIDALLGSRSHIYHFTHALFYWTDFGAAPRRLPRAKASAAADAGIALGRCLDEDDFDLGGEVLLVWPMLGLGWPAAAAFGFDVLCRAEDAWGFLPSPTLKREQHDALEGDARLSYVASEGYHTIYVMGLLCSVALRAGRSTRTGQPRHGVSRAIRPLLGAARPQRQWEQAFATLPDARQDALGDFLVAVALRRAFVQHDFRRVRAILALTLEHDLPPSPAVLQAARFLQRCAGSPRLRAAGPGPGAGTRPLVAVASS